MKVAFVSSDGDYGAEVFEEEIGLRMLPYLWEQAHENGGEIFINPKTKEIYKTCEEASKSLDDEDEQYSFPDTPIQIKSYEFGEVDPKFIEFVMGEFVDGYHASHRNFYVVEQPSVI